MAKTFSDYLEKFTPEEQGEIKAHTRLLVAEYELLAKLRQDHDLTQQELADLMNIRQASVSKLEHQNDILVSTLQTYVEALGGELEIRAKFPDGAVTLSQFAKKRAA